MGISSNSLCTGGKHDCWACRNVKHKAKCHFQDKILINHHWSFCYWCCPVMYMVISHHWLSPRPWTIHNCSNSVSSSKKEWMIKWTRKLWRRNSMDQPHTDGESEHSQFLGNTPWIPSFIYYSGFRQISITSLGSCAILLSLKKI